MPQSSLVGCRHPLSTGVVLPASRLHHLFIYDYIYLFVDCYIFIIYLLIGIYYYLLYITKNYVDQSCDSLVTPSSGQTKMRVCIYG